MGVLTRRALLFGVNIRAAVIVFQTVVPEGTYCAGI